MQSSGGGDLHVSIAENVKSQQRQAQKRDHSTRDDDASDGATQQPCKKPTTSQAEHVWARPVPQVRDTRGLEERMRRDKWTIKKKRCAGREYKLYYMDGDPHGYRSLVDVARNYYPECLEDDEDDAGDSSEATAAPGAAGQRYKEGQKVWAQFKREATFWPGRIVRYLGDKRYEILYKDGDRESNVHAALIRARVEPAAPPDAHTSSMA